MPSEVIVYETARARAIKDPLQFAVDSGKGIHTFTVMWPDDAGPLGDMLAGVQLGVPTPVDGEVGDTGATLRGLTEMGGKAKGALRELIMDDQRDEWDEVAPGIDPLLAARILSEQIPRITGKAFTSPASSPVASSTPGDGSTDGAPPEV